MDGLLVLLGATGLLTLLGHLAAVFGADSREDSGDDPTTSILTGH